MAAAAGVGASVELLLWDGGNLQMGIVTPLMGQAVHEAATPHIGVGCSLSCCSSNGGGLLMVLLLHSLILISLQNLKVEFFGS